MDGRIAVILSTYFSFFLTFFQSTKVAICIGFLFVVNCFLVSFVVIDSLSFLD